MCQPHSSHQKLLQGAVDKDDISRKHCKHNTWYSFFFPKSLVKSCPVLFSSSLDSRLCAHKLYIYTQWYTLYCFESFLSSVHFLFYLPYRAGVWEGAAEFLVESFIVCGATRSHNTNSSGDLERQAVEGIENSELLCIFMMQVNMRFQDMRKSLHHHVSCTLSSPSVPLELCLFSLDLTMRSWANPQVYWFPYKGITQSTAEASVECLLFFFCLFF